MAREHTITDVYVALCAAGVTAILNDEGTSLLILTDTEQSKIAVKVTINDARLVLAASALYPFRIPDGKRLAMAEYAMRIRENEDGGGLLLDMDRGDLAYVVEALFEEDGFSPALRARVICDACAGLERHVHGISRVVNDGFKPTEALDDFVRFDMDYVLGQANDDLTR